MEQVSSSQERRLAAQRKPVVPKQKDGLNGFDIAWESVQIGNVDCIFRVVEKKQTGSKKSLWVSTWFFNRGDAMDYIEEARDRGCNIVSLTFYEKARHEDF